MRIILYIFAIFFFQRSQGQNKHLLYNVDELPNTLMSNPGASIYFDGHLGLPLLSQIHLSAGSTGVNLYDIFDDSNPNINERIRATVKRLTSKDYFVINEQLEILNLGWRLDNDHYLSAGIYQELDVFAYFPKDIAVLALEGNNDYIGKPFDFSQLSFTGEVLTVYHIGLNKKIDRRLTIGARLKLYSGIFNAESVDNEGVFITRHTSEGPNYYRHYAENLDLRINTAGYASLTEANNTVQEATADVLSRSFFGGNIGAGIDLGGTYILNDQMVVTGAVQDIGLMLQRDDVENYLYYGSYQTDGLEPLFPDTDASGRAIPYWDIFEDEIDANLIDETLNEKYITWRPFKVNASIQYGFGQTFAPCNYLRPVNRRLRNLVGIQVFGIRRPKGMRYALSAFYDKKFSTRLRMKFAYTLDDFSYTNVGVLMSTRYKSFNFYMAADNLLGYFNLAKTNSASLQMGMQFILNR